MPASDLPSKLKIRTLSGRVTYNVRRQFPFGTAPVAIAIKKYFRCSQASIF
ncbi:MAG: hypothetical protein LWY06_11075 [Firmicutes bacterium]|nr:hypothetical protein [Bacillota bacterium]